MTTVRLIFHPQRYRPTVVVTWPDGTEVNYAEPTDLLVALLEGRVDLDPAGKCELAVVGNGGEGTSDTRLITVAFLTEFLLDLHLKLQLSHDLERRVSVDDDVVTYVLDGGEVKTAAELMLSLKYQGLLEEDAIFRVRFLIDGVADPVGSGLFLAVSDLMGNLLSDEVVLAECRAAGFQITEARDGHNLTVLFPAVN